MRKLTTLLVSALALLALSGCDGTTDLNSFPLQEPAFEYEIDTWGFNSEVYEFNPMSAPNKACVMLMLDGGNSVALQCFDK